MVSIINIFVVFLLSFNIGSPNRTENMWKLLFSVLFTFETEYVFPQNTFLTEFSETKG